MKMMKNNDFVAFILTHGRPNTVVTYDRLKRSGYTGRIIFVIDNEDKTADEYYKNFGDQVVMFDKAAIAKTFDNADNFNDRRAIIYARNACFQIAKDLGIKYFIQLDDDYTEFQYRFDNNLDYKYKQIKNLNAIFDIMLDYYISIPAKSIALSQGGDFIGGSEGSFAKGLKLKRKCMNTFICSTERPFQFVGRINEDVNTYTRKASTGDLFLTIPNVSIVQKQTQSNKGGMTDIYLDNGTYVKSFYSVMFHPSSVKIKMMGSTHKRLHHSVTWKNTVPQIVDEKYKKVLRKTKQDAEV